MSVGSFVKKKKIFKERINNPSATLKQIGDKYGLSRERIRQILVAEDLPTRHKRIKYICNQCFQEFLPVHEASRIFCSPECKKAYSSATLECEECGRLFETSYSSLKGKVVKLDQQHFFCSRSCKSKRLGQKYGFRAHPENGSGGYNRGQRKWAKYAPRIIEMLRRGWLLNNIMDQLGIPRGSYILIREMILKSA